MGNVSIGFVGTGSVGTALAVALSRAGYNIVAVGSRRQEPASALAAQLNQGTAAVPPTQVAERCDVVFNTITVAAPSGSM